MTLQELHSNEDLRRREFPVVEKEIFLAHAGVCPLPTRVAAAMRDYAGLATQGNQEAFAPLKLHGETRRLAADLLGCGPEDIALIGPTSIGLSLVANGLKFDPGQNVIFPPDDYPSNSVVWMNLEKRGIELRPVLPRVPGWITVDDIASKVDERTRLVALSSAHFITGYRLDTEGIGSFLKERSILFCLDAIQTVGAFPTPAAHVDFLAADAHKWMLGPCAAGIFYVSPDARKQLEPTLLGWNNVICPDYITPEAVVFENDARSYEAGTHSVIGLVGLNACLQLLKEFTPEAIAETLLGHTRLLRAALTAKGYTLASEDEERLSGITSFYREDADMAALQRKLAEAGITATLRRTRDQRWWLRFSPHCYNTTEELERTLELL